MITLIKKNIHNLLNDKKFEEILTGSAWALSARIMATGLSLMASIIIARIYGAEILGIVAMLDSFLILATIFTVLGTNTAILRIIPEHLAKYSPASAFKAYRKIQFFVAGVSIVTGAIFFLGADIIAEKIFSKSHLSFYFAMTAVFIIFKSLMNLNTHAIRGLRLIRAYAFMQMLPSLANLIVLIIITIFFFHPDNPIYAMLASILTTAVIGAWIMDRTFKKKTNQEEVVHSMSIPEIVTLSLPMLMTATMSFVIGQTGVIMLGIFRSEAEVGYYAIAVKLATLTSFILVAVGSMAAPKFSELFHSGKIDDLFHVAKKSAKLIFWISTPILLGIVIFGKPILHMAFGNDFVAAYPALTLLAMGQFVNSISGSTGHFMNMTGNQKILRNIIFFAALSNIGLNLLFIPEHGIYGAAIAGMFSLAGWNIATLCYIKIKFGKTTGYFPMLS